MKVFYSIFLILVLFFATHTSLVQANSFNSGLNTTANSGGFTSNANNVSVTQESLTKKVTTILQVLLSLVGVFFLILMFYAGYRWMTARENASETTKAKDMIVNAVIGLIVILSAYAITMFISGYLSSLS